MVQRCISYLRHLRLDDLMHFAWQRARNGSDYEHLEERSLPMPPMFAVRYLGCPDIQKASLVQTESEYRFPEPNLPEKEPSENPFYEVKMVRAILVITS